MGEFEKILPTLGEVFTDVGWQYTPVVCSYHNRISQIHPVHSLFICYKKTTYLDRHGLVSTHKDVLLY